MVKEHGSHTVFLGTVAGLETSDGSGLLYRDGYFRRLAAE
jgi:flavin reductase (NADH)